MQGLISSASSKGFTACGCAAFSVSLRRARQVGVAARLQQRQPALQSSALCGASSQHKSESTEVPTSAYVHLPFCKRRCYYCDFPIQAVGANPDLGHVQSGMQDYVDLLCREIRATARLGKEPLKTVFFGGGTPSLIPPHMLQQVLQALQLRFGIEDGTEVSMEADPGTFDVTRLRKYMKLGVSRFSIGVQAFQQDILEACGRSHVLEDVHTAIEDVHAAGVTNWSLDLISGLPYMSEELWLNSLNAAIAASPTHVSVYDLQVEEKTKFGKWYTPEQFPLPTNDTAARMYCLAAETLTAGGFEHYEISSYAKPGHRCKHNLIYWSGRPFYAFGVGAASYLQHRRFSRPRSMAGYRAWVPELEARAPAIPGMLEDEPAESASERLLDMVMLRLRVSDGLDFRIVGEQYGEQSVDVIKQALEPHVKAGTVEEIGSSVRLRDPEGFLVSNGIISDVFAALDGGD